MLVKRSQVKIQPNLQQRIKTAIAQEEEYAEVWEELQREGVREHECNNVKYKLRHGMLVRHKNGERKADESYWRIVVPDDNSIKHAIISEMHSVPYAGHPGYQRTLHQVKRNFYWIGMRGDIQAFVPSCPVCQVEKAEHTLVCGQLQSLQIPKEKWREVSLDFVTDLPVADNGDNAVLNIIDRAPRMVHCLPCRTTITAAQIAKLYWRHVGKLHGIPSLIYLDRGSVFTGEFWKTLWSTLGTQLCYSTAYHPQTQGVIERMNQTV